MEIKQLTNEQFTDFANHFKINSIYQTVEYGLIMNHQHFDSVLIGLVDEGNIVAATLLLIEESKTAKTAYAPRGFLIDYDNFSLLATFTNELKKYLSKLGILIVKLNPLIIKDTYDRKQKIHTPNPYYENIFKNLQKLGYKHLGYNSFFENIKPRYEAIIDLEKPYYLLFKNIRKEFRTKIRSAEKKGINIYKGNQNNLDYLYLQTKKKYPRDLQYFNDCYNYFGKKDKLEFYYAKLDTAKYLKICNLNFQNQEKICNQYNEQLMSSNKDIINRKLEADKLLNQYKKELIMATNYLRDYPDGIVMAAALIVKTRKQIHLLMDGFNPKYKSFNAKHLLLWKISEKYAKEGYQSFNLGGITNPEIKNNPYQGLNEFKLGFSANAIEYIGDLELVCNPTLHFVYKNFKVNRILKK